MLSPVDPHAMPGYEHLLEQIARIPRLGSLNLACGLAEQLGVGENDIPRESFTHGHMSLFREIMVTTLW